MYATGVWSVVYALDAKTGKELWTYDPQVPREWGRYACCDAVNRGVALWGDALYFATLDGRLISLTRARASGAGRSTPSTEPGPTPSPARRA
jgi:quinohemoprotein ethanol dehydrogenase